MQGPVTKEGVEGRTKWEQRDIGSLRKMDGRELDSKKGKGRKEHRAGANRRRMILWLNHRIGRQDAWVPFPAVPLLCCLSLERSRCLPLPELLTYKIRVIILTWLPGR